jgi:hypothetical protein
MGRWGRSRHPHLHISHVPSVSACLVIVQNRLCACCIHFGHKYLCYLCPSWLRYHKEVNLYFNANLLLQDMLKVLEKFPGTSE